VSTFNLQPASLGVISTSSEASRKKGGSHTFCGEGGGRSAARHGGKREGHIRAAADAKTTGEAKWKGGQRRGTAEEGGHIRSAGEAKTKEVSGETWQKKGWSHTSCGRDEGEGRSAARHGGKRGGHIQAAGEAKATGEAKAKGGQRRGMAKQGGHILSVGEAKGGQRQGRTAEGGSHTVCGGGEDEGRSATRHGGRRGVTYSLRARQR
jgi:hypothetical protein